MFISLLPTFPRDFRRKLEFRCGSNVTCSNMSNTKATCCDLVFAIIVSGQIPAEEHLQTECRVANRMFSHPKHLQRHCQLRLHIQIRIDVSHQQIQMSQYLVFRNSVLFGSCVPKSFRQLPQNVSEKYSKMAFQRAKPSIL